MPSLEPRYNIPNKIFLFFLNPIVYPERFVRKIKTNSLEKNRGSIVSQKCKNLPFFRILGQNSTFKKLKTG